MVALGMTPTVFKTNWPPNMPEQIIPHDPVFKYDVTGTGNREELQYHIMHNGKQLLWCIHDCLGDIILDGYETADQALLAFEARLNAMGRAASSISKSSVVVSQDLSQ